MKELTRALAPGRTDGVVAILVGTLLFSAVFGLISSLDKTAVFAAPQSILYAVAGGFTVASLAVTDLWLLLGNPSLMRRWFSVLFVGQIPCIGLALGFYHGIGRAAHSSTLVYESNVPSLLESIFVLITFRLVATCCLGIPSIYLRTLTRWRIAHVDGQLSQRSMFQTSLSELMLLTANVAVALGSLRIIWSMVNTNGVQTVKAIGLASAIEFASLLILVLLPLAIDLRADRRRRKMPLLLPVWTALVGGFAGIVFFFLRFRAPHAESVAMSIFWACFSFGIAVFLWWKIAERIGLKWTTGTAETQRGLRPQPNGVPLALPVPIQIDTGGASGTRKLARRTSLHELAMQGTEVIRSPRVNPRFASILTVSLVGLLLFCYQHDVFVMLNGESLRTARRLASVSRFFSAWPRWDELHYTWKSKSVSVQANYTTARFQFHANDDLPPELLVTAIPNNRPVQLQIKTGFIGGDVLEILSNLSLASLELDCDQIDPSALDEFCCRTDLVSLAISCGELTPQHVRSLHCMAALNDLSFSFPDQTPWSFYSLAQNRRINRSRAGLKPIVYSPEMRDALRGLPISHVNPLPLHIPDGASDLTQFKGLHGLIVVESPLTQQLCEQLGNDDLFLNRKEFRKELPRSSWPAIPYLRLVDCPPSKTAIHGLHLINTPWISWSFSMQGTDASESELLDLAEMPNLVELDVRDRALDEIFVARFQRRRGNNGPYCTIRSGVSGHYASNHMMYEDTVDHVEYLLAKHDADLDRALSELAHSIVRSESGEIHELDLQWMRITPSGLSQLQLSGLRRLRIGHPLQNAELFESVAKLQSLRVLEIPTPWVTDADLAQISKLRNLTRLQLPLQNNAMNLPHPEQVPFPQVLNGETPFHNVYADYYQSRFSPDYLNQLISNRGVLLHDRRTGGYHVEFSSGSVNWQRVSPDSRLTDLGIANLAALQQLEYLFLPGFLLSADTINTLESLPKLRELHALFSNASPALLKRVCGLDLESLSIGVTDIDEAARQWLANMPRLSMLQLFVFNMDYKKDEQEHNRIAAELREALPRCEVHIQLLPRLQQSTAPL